MTRPRLPLALLAALALTASAAFGLAACGGESASDQSPQELLKDTFGPDHEIKSGKLDIALQLDLNGLDGLSDPVAIKLTGPFQSQGKDKLPKFDLALRLSSSGQSFSAGAVSTGEKGFIKLQGQAYDVGAQIFDQFEKGYAEAQKASKNDEGTTLSSLGVNPSNWLQNPRRAGEEKVGGADTVHVTAGIDVERFLRDVDTLLKKAGDLGVTGATGAEVPQGLTDKQRRDIASAVKSASLDVYPGADDKTLRRLKLQVVLDVPQAVRRSVGGLTDGTIGFDMTIGDLNEDQEIKSPSGARPLAELSQALGGLLGGSGSGGSSSGSGSGSGNGSGSADGAQSAYLQCVQAAGQDIAKVQDCAKHLE